MRHSLSRRVAALVVVGGLLGSFMGLNGCKRAPPSSPEECAALGDASARDECYLVVAPAVFATDAKAGIALVESGISDPLTRDMAWYNITKNVDPHSNKYCDRIKDTTLAERCRTIVSRPHLHRELTGGPPGGVDHAAPPEGKKRP